MYSRSFVLALTRLQGSRLGALQALRRRCQRRQRQIAEVRPRSLSLHLPNESIASEYA